MGVQRYCKQMINISYFYDLLESMENHRRLSTCGFIFRAHAGVHRCTAQCEFWLWLELLV